MKGFYQNAQKQHRTWVILQTQLGELVLIDKSHWDNLVCCDTYLLSKLKCVVIS